MPADCLPGHYGNLNVDLAWNASSHDTGIQQYLVFRNGLLVGATSPTSYRDTGFALPADRGVLLHARSFLTVLSKGEQVLRWVMAGLPRFFIL